MCTLILTTILFCNRQQAKSEIDDGKVFAQKLQEMPTLVNMPGLSKNELSAIASICDTLSRASIEIIRSGIAEYKSNYKWMEKGIDPFCFKPYVFNRYYFNIPANDKLVNAYFLQEGDVAHWKQAWPWESRGKAVAIGVVQKIQILTHVKPKYDPLRDFDDLRKQYKKREEVGALLTVLFSWPPDLSPKN